MPIGSCPKGVQNAGGVDKKLRFWTGQRLHGSDALMPKMCPSAMVAHDGALAEETCSVINNFGGS